ncbi:polysaccharide biosynthesis protein [Geotalea uraniireducens Rf4]|uniref:Polysaccharide biosynthesis protein n=2 Tax=Geotalea uraniireducens TaxID=351604 RepID=A5G4Q4_GEOUR|nr:polysaccharide biosynthesis protein [Geotalea uraniireducens Rf4]
MLKNILSKILGSQLRLNLFSGMISASISFVLSIIKYPIFLCFMSYEMYGVWLILTTVLSFAQLGLTGVTVGVVKLVAEEYGKNNIADIEKYVATSLSALFVLGSLFLGISLCFDTEIVRLIGLSGSNAILGMRYLPYIAILSMYIFAYEVINATLSGLGRIDIANYSQTLIQAIPLVIAIPLLMLNVSEIMSMLIAHTAAYIIISITNIYKIKTLVTLKILSMSNISYFHFRKLLKYSGSIFVSSVASLLFFPLSKIIVSRQLGVSIVPLYEVAYRASSQLMTVYSMGLRALTPEISRLSGISDKSNDNKINSINAKAYKLTILGGTITCALVYVFAELIFRLWLSKSFNAEIVTCFRIMLGGTLACIVTLVPYYNLIGRGSINPVVIYHCISPIISISMIITLTKTTEITLNGIALSNTLGLTAGTIFLIWATVKSNHKINKQINQTPIIE